MFYRGVWVVAYRDLLRFAQERSRIVSALGFPLLYFVVFGAGLNRTIGAMTPGVSFIKFLYPGVIAMAVLQTSLSAGTSVVWERQMRVLREIFASPVSRSGAILGKAVGAAALGLLQAGVLLLLAPLLGVALTPLLVLQLLALIVLASLCLSSIGLLFAAYVHSAQGYAGFMQLAVFPLIFTAGVFFPVGNIPIWLQVIAKASPATYAVDAIRQLFLGDQLTVARGLAAARHATLGLTLFGHTMTIAEDALIDALWGLVLMTAAIWAFDRQDG